MLADVVHPVRDAIAAQRSWNGVPTACHFGTCYWLFQAEFRRPPTLDEYAEYIGNPQLLIRDLLPFGRTQTRDDINRGLIPGTVIVFVKDGGIPDHSCVVVDPFTLAGYNQGYVFLSGSFLQFSRNSTRDLRWYTGSSTQHRNQVQCNISIVEWASIVAIPESAAKAVLGRRCLRN